MARLKFEPNRSIDTLPEHVGKVLLFCEGETEKNYFEYFKDVFLHEEFKFSDIVIETVCGNGNAQTVLDKANEFFDDDQNVKKYQDYRKYLVFDCDAPSNVQEVICNALKSPMNYQLLLSNLLFETWLMMHFREVETRLKKKATYQAMADYYHVDSYGSKEKADKGLLRGLIGDGESVRLAISNAENLAEFWNAQHKRIQKDISDMNPYTQMHLLMKEIMDELQYSTLAK